jgi:hypothetical protein
MSDASEAEGSVRLTEQEQRWSDRYDAARVRVVQSPMTAWVPPTVEDLIGREKSDRPEWVALDTLWLLGSVMRRLSATPPRGTENRRAELKELLTIQRQCRSILDRLAIRFAKEGV